MGKFLLVIALFALLVYGAIWLLERRSSRRGPRPQPRRAPAPPPRTVAPDDDEDFLRELERRRRRAAREQRPTKPEAPGEEDRKGQSPE